MENSDADYVANKLNTAYLKNSLFPRSVSNLLTVETAYDAQFKLLNLRQNQGEELVGWKVGLTSSAMQKQQGVHEPCLGHLLGSGHCIAPVSFRYDALHSPGFENELCLRLKKPLTGSNISLEQVVDAVDAIAPALEIIEKRSAFGADFPLAIAGNAQQHSFVTGEFVDFDPSIDLSKVAVTVNVNGQVMEKAVGKEVLGTPLNSIVWLANKLAEFDRQLEAGALIMTGSFTKQYALERGDHVRSIFGGVGTAEAKFE